MPKITVIMPALNVGIYVKKCIESVLSQTYRDIEILFIDAGSTDGTLEIAEEYIKKDDRFNIIHSNRKSYGYQINLGVSMANGEYVGIVETDDYIESDAYEHLLDAIERYDCDYVKGRANCFNERNPYELGWIHNPLGNSDVLPECIVLFEKPEIEYTDRFIWLGLYKKSLMQQIKLNESQGAAYQDIDFSLQLHTKARKALYIDKVVYNYRTFAIGSSTVNHKAFKYIADEYDYCSTVLEKCETGIRDYYITKLIDQTKNRYITMASSCDYWEEQACEMKRIINILLDEINKGYNPGSYLDEVNAKFLDSLLKSERAPYDLYVPKYRNVRDKLKSLKGKIGGRETVLMGCGKRSAFCQTLVEKLGTSKILAYADNNRKDGLNELRSIPIFSVEKACNQFLDAVFVITSQKYADEMKAQLISNGIEDAHICIVDIDTDNSFLSMIPD